MGDYLAKVPIALGFLDYRRKIGGIGPLVYPTGDIAVDMEIIMAFYDGVPEKTPPNPWPLANSNVQTDISKKLGAAG
jgi:hypothetical protein